MNNSEKFKIIHNELKKNQDILVRLDVIFARAKYSIHIKGVSADITDERIIDIQSIDSNNVLRGDDHNYSQYAIEKRRSCWLPERIEKPFGKG